MLCQHNKVEAVLSNDAFNRHCRAASRAMSPSISGAFISLLTPVTNRRSDIRPLADSVNRRRAAGCLRVNVVLFGVRKIVSGHIAIPIPVPPAAFK